MLMPKRVKHRKQFRGRMKGAAHRGNFIANGYIGLMAILLLIAASFVANVLAGVIALLMIRKGMRKQGA